VSSKWQCLLTHLDELCVDLAAHYSCRAPLFGPDHTHHDRFQIGHVIRGSGPARIDGQRVTVGVGDTVFVRPGQRHSSDDESTNYELIEIKFTADSPAAALAVPEIPLLVRSHGDPELLTGLERLVEARMSEADPRGWLSRVRLVEVLMLLSGKHLAGGRPTHPPTDLERRIAQAAQFIARNYSGSVTVRALADLVGLSPSHFSACYRRIMKVSPAEAVIQRRLQHACELLAETSLPVSDVAELCGFSSSQYLARLFSRRHGMSPSRYRQVARGRG